MIGNYKIQCSANYLATLKRRTERTSRFSADGYFKSHKIKDKWVNRVSWSVWVSLSLREKKNSHLTPWWNSLLISDFALVIDFLCVFVLNYSVAHFISSLHPSHQTAAPHLPPPSHPPSHLSLWSISGW